MKYIFLLLTIPMAVLADTSVYLGAYDADTSELKTESSYIGVGVEHLINDYVAVNAFYGDEVDVREGETQFTLNTFFVNGDEFGEIIVSEPRLKTDNMLRAGLHLRLPINDELSLYGGVEWFDIGSFKRTGGVAGARLDTGELVYRIEYFDAGSGVDGVGLTLGKKI